MKRSENKAITQRTAHGTGVHVYDNFASSEPENRPPPASILPSWVIGAVESELIAAGILCPFCRRASMSWEEYGLHVLAHRKGDGT